MPVYHHHKLALSRDKAKKLLMGQSVRLSHADLDGDVPIALLASHYKKLAKAYEAKKGATLRLSASHAKYLGTRFHKEHGLEGGDIWGDIWSGIKKVGGFAKDVIDSPTTKKIVSAVTQLPIVKQGINALEQGANTISDKISPNLKVGTKAKDALANYTAGYGMKKRGRPSKAK